MKMFVAYVQSLDVPFDWRTMCREQDSGYDMVMRETEGSVATIDLERRQTGWAILGAGRPRCAIVSWTPTDAAADAVVLARGRIVGLPNDLLAAVQTITLECGPADVSDRLLAFCKAELAAGPETDFLFTDADPDDVESYLLGRSGSLHVDPATHDVGYSDDLVGDTVHDLADGFVTSSSQGVFDAPVRRYRAKVVCDWTQEADGRVDVAGRINAGSAIPTLDSGFAGRIASSLSASGADGWSTAGEPETTTFVTETFPQIVGSTYVAVGFNRRLVFLGPAQGGYGIVRADEDAIRSRHDVSPVFQRYDVTVTRFPMSYRYSQDRRDTAYVVLEVPVQDSVVVADRDLETVEWSLGDVFDDTTIPAWEQNVDYALGDVVRYGGRFHECILAHRSAGFDDDTGTVYRRRVPDIEPPYFETTRTHWLRTRPTSIPSRALTTRFLSTARGELCLRHAVLRLRKEGRRRLRAWHVVVEAEWLQAVDVRLTDSVSVIVPWDGEGAHRRAVGKVVGIERQWRGGSAPIVRIELGIAFGMGGSPVGGTGEDAYVEPGYVDEEYLGAVGPTDLMVRIEAENPKIPVRVEQLSSPGYAVLGCTVRNEAADQLLSIGETLEAGADITEISVRKPTSVRINMRPLEMSSEAFEREIDVVADLLVTPAGIDLS